ncbi:hypothetical protein B0T13DRAFT_477517 [Neurospora crassa]|nr:hypothetical protein B0T13DRAFT_477517 [Neurospora crassa]
MDGWAAVRWRRGRKGGRLEALWFVIVARKVLTAGIVSISSSIKRRSMMDTHWQGRSLEAREGGNNNQSICPC